MEKHTYTEIQIDKRLQELVYPMDRQYNQHEVDCKRAANTLF